jgi:hypothetical protein
MAFTTSSTCINALGFCKEISKRGSWKTVFTKARLNEEGRFYKRRGRKFCFPKSIFEREAFSPKSFETFSTQVENSFSKHLFL